MAEINIQSLTNLARSITNSIISFSSIIIGNSLHTIAENEGLYLFTTTSIVQSIFLLYTYNARKKPIFYIKAASENDKNKKYISILHLIDNCPSLFNYSPSILYAFDYVGQLQTAGQTLLKTIGYYLNIGSNLQFFRELVLLSDGGSVALDWVVSLKGHNIEPFFNSKPINPNPFNNNTTKSIKYEDDKPIVIVHHGLCGHSRTEYLVHMVEHLTKLHYKVVVVIGRGCGDIELTTSMPWSFNQTLDYQEVVDYIHSRHPQRQLYSIGYSLGASLTLNYCGRNDKKSPLSGAIAISPAWDFDVKRTFLFNLIWTKVLVQLIKGYYYINISKFDPEVMKLIQSCDSMTSYDEIVSSKFFGFKNRLDYYANSSPIHEIHNINTIPVLAISSIDDPICNIRGLTNDPVVVSIEGSQKDKGEFHSVSKMSISSGFGSSLVVAVVELGGHIGFAEENPLSINWVDRVCVDWIEAIVADKKNKATNSGRYSKAITTSNNNNNNNTTPSSKSINKLSQSLTPAQIKANYKVNSPMNNDLGGEIDDYLANKAKDGIFSDNESDGCSTSTTPIKSPMKSPMKL